MMHSKKHPGFAHVVSQMAQKQDISHAEAAMMLAARTRNASMAAKKANPRLKRVKG